MPGTGTGDDHAARYAALYQEHNGRLVAYARSLTGSGAVAEDLAAEAHFRVWRRIQAGYAVDDVAAYLTTTVRNLAAGLSRGRREVPRDVAGLPQGPARDPAGAGAAADPERRASHVDLISRLLRELPERWAKALWYAEVEDLSREEVGERIGAGAGTTAVVLARARERLRQAFLQSQPGTPSDMACEPYWRQLPAIVRRTASPRRAKSVIDHCDGCQDCHSRMLALTEANTRLPALLGPAILTGVLAGGSWLLPMVTSASATAGAVGTVGAATARSAARAAVRSGSKARHARISPRTRLLKHRLTPARAVVIGSTAAVGLAATVATLALGSSPAASQTPAALSPMTAPAIIQPSVAAGNGATSATSTPAATASTASIPAQSASAAATSTSAAQQTPAAGPVAAQSDSAAPATDPTTATGAAASSTSPATSPSPSASSPATVGGPVLLITPSASSTSGSPTMSAAPTESATPTPTPSPSTPTTSPASPSASPADSVSASASATESATPTLTAGPALTSSPSLYSSPLCTFSIISTCVTETPSVD